MINNRKKIKILQKELTATQKQKAQETKVYQSRVETLEERIRQLKQDEAKHVVNVQVDREKNDKVQRDIADI